MIRVITITFFSFCMVVPFLALFHRYLGMGDEISSYISFLLAWLVLPMILLKTWKVPPYFSDIPVDMNDPIMKKQIERSRSEMDRFFLGLSEGKQRAYVKFPIEIDGDVEHVWNEVHAKDEEKIVVSLASELVAGVPDEAFERMKIPVDEIEDWILQNAKGDVAGGFTMLAMAQIYEREYGKLPKKYAKDLENFVDFKWPVN